MAERTTERAFSKQVIALAREHEWIVAHFHTAQSAKGHWITPVAADGKGFPDLCLARERIIFAELKVGSNVLRPDQRMWLEELGRAGAETYTWYPRDLEEIEQVLSLRIPLDTLARLVAASGGDIDHARRIAIDTALTKRKSRPKAALLVSNQTSRRRDSGERR